MTNEAKDQPAAEDMERKLLIVHGKLIGTYSSSDNFIAPKKVRLLGLSVPIEVLEVNVHFYDFEPVLLLNGLLPDCGGLDVNMTRGVFQAWDDGEESSKEVPFAAVLDLLPVQVKDDPPKG